MKTQLVATSDRIIAVRCMRDNIRSMLERDYQTAEFERGWYVRAYQWALGVADKHCVSIQLVASVAAVLSPNTDWVLSNMPMTEALFENADAETFINANGTVCKFVGYGFNIRKARQMVKSGDLTLCSGPKVTRFRDAILGIDACVIDIHATNIAMGTVNVFSGPAKNVYGVFVEAYTEVANSLGWRVCEVQSATWVIYKNTKGGK